MRVLRPVATREMTRLSNTQIRVLKAREEVARQNVFFEAILYTARLIETDYAPHGMKTMFTNGIDIYFHPDFVRANDDTIEGGVLHETLHCAFCHAQRRGDRNPALWNVACDFAINPLIQSMFALPGKRPHRSEIFRHECRAHLCSTGARP